MARQSDDNNQSDSQIEAQTLAYLRELEVSFARWIQRQPDVASTLRRLRDRQCISLAEASARAGISREYLSHIEHGRHVPLRTLVLIGSCSYSLTARMVRELLIFAVECDERERTIRNMKEKEAKQEKSEKQEGKERKEGGSDAQV